MAKILLKLFGVLLLLMGTGILLYPTISNWLARQNQSTAIQEYTRNVEKMDARIIEEEMKNAQAYNDSLIQITTSDPFALSNTTSPSETYNSTLNINGIIGYIDIPQINVYLPIYHGTSEEVLQKGIGHLENTALPIGENGTHTVLTGHSGLPETKFFDNLEQMAEKDVFYLHVLDKTFAYEVNQILVVDPDDTEALQPAAGKNYTTLVTCTPYAVNSHRLLVRGVRIPYEQDGIKTTGSMTADTVNWYYVVGIIGFAAICVIFFFIYRRLRRQN